MADWLKNIPSIARYSLLAGFMIGVGCIVYSVVESHILGSFLFSLGLITVLVQQYSLYTGRIGYATVNTFFKDLLPILLFNLIGIGLICYLFGTYSTIPFNVESIVEAKCNESFLDALIRSIGCGIMMYVAVDGYKKNQKFLNVILPVMVFILCGFDHCIANYGYLALNGVFFTWQLPVWVLGNSIGSIIFCLLRK